MCVFIIVCECTFVLVCVRNLVYVCVHVCACGGCGVCDSDDDDCGHVFGGGGTNVCAYVC